MHGNAVAFRAALADVERHNIDLIVSLGDVAQGGPQPKECVDLLRELGCPCVFGNSDDFLLTLDFGAEPVEDEERRERTPARHGRVVTRATRRRRADVSAGLPTDRSER